MELERWHRVDNILQAALALNPAERSVFVDGACEGDETLRDEVVSLLSLEEEGLDIIDTPALEAAACVLASDQPDLPSPSSCQSPLPWSTDTTKLTPF